MKLTDKAAFLKFDRPVNFSLLSLLWISIIALTLVQDYFGTKWNGKEYDLFESLAYKIFWLLFIPSYIIHKKTWSRIEGILNLNRSRMGLVAFSALFTIVIGLIHLVFFSYCLYIISPLFHDEQWNLALLIKEKLTTRLYIVISVYSVFSFFMIRSKHEGGTESRTEYPSFMKVRNGSRSTIVEMENIKWIQSDGGYLEMHALDKKHVMMESLKSLLNSLNPEQFMRIHKSTIVNVKMIEELKSRHNGDYDVYLKDGNVLRLSRNYAKPLKGLFL